MKRKLALLLSFIVIACIIIIVICIAITNNSKITYNQPIIETVTYQASDGLTITAEKRLVDNYSPIILLFHQAKSSRGEYLTIAPLLNKLGFNTLAVDTRSGFARNGIINETSKLAKEKNVPRNYYHAKYDVDASIEYATSSLKYQSIILWGSSYTSSLVLAMASEYDSIVGVLAFSPDEYFEYELSSIKDSAKNIIIPVFITGAKGESQAFSSIYHEIVSQEKTLFIPEKLGKHGASTLETTSYGHEEYWHAVRKFLRIIKPET